MKAGRKRLGLTMLELGERIGRDQSTISRIEKGARAEKATLIALGRELNDDFGEVWLRESLSQTGDKFGDVKEIENLSVEELLGLKMSIGDAQGLPKVRQKELLEMAKSLDRAVERELELASRRDER